MRLALHWEGRLRKHGFDAEIRAETRNLSSEGFYCVSPEPFTPGEKVDCALAVPAPSTPGQPHSLHCRCTVLRMEKLGEGMFGIACTIDEYSASPSSMA